MDNSAMVAAGLFPNSSLHPRRPFSPSEDDEEPSRVEENANNGCKQKKGASSSPWHRMKWTDDMVRLLIAVVAYLDVATPEPGVGSPLAERKALLKKGKWKAVSKLLMDKECYVSPQQCEDKFNDLNKRYKRLNEILGRGTTCRVVENPTLLESMSHISAKAKEDVKRILSSKHLFYREMCAYHNGQIVPSSHGIEQHNGNAHGCETGGHREEVEDEQEEEEESEEMEDKRDGLEKFKVEMEGVLRDETTSMREKREWFKKRRMNLLEERMGIFNKGFELENQRFKWKRFSSKKDLELEGLRLQNERLRLENEKMAVLVQRRELELDVQGSGELLNSSCYRVEMGNQGR
ncbi:putative myb/SANT-like DNA-binding domain 4 [Dioscorea sansibarensis]